MDEDQAASEKLAEDKEKAEKKEANEKKEPEIIRVIPSYNVSNFIAENNKPLNATSTAKVFLPFIRKGKSRPWGNQT